MNNEGFPLEQKRCAGEVVFPAQRFRFDFYSALAHTASKPPYL
jgi:hypothetical protein